MTTGPFALVRHMAAIFDGLGVSYALGGSLASSLFGEPRSGLVPDGSGGRRATALPSMSDVDRRAGLGGQSSAVHRAEIGTAQTSLPSGSTWAPAYITSPRRNCSG